MANDDSPVGYKRPPVDGRFRKGKSGNPGGRPRKQPDFFEDANAILGAPVTGHANGKEITLPAMQAIFRGLCRKALKGDNGALRRVIELMLTLEPEARDQAEQNATRGNEAKRKLAIMAGLDPDAVNDRPREPNPRMDELQKQADAMAREERKRLIREARQHQQNR